MDFLKVLTIILFILLTILTIKIHPDMHQPMIIEDEHFKLTRISDTIPVNNLPVTPAAKKTPSETSKAESVKTPDITEKQPQVIEIKNQQTAENIEKYIEAKPQKIEKTEKKIVQKNIPDETSQLELLQRIIEQAQEETAEEPIQLSETKKTEVNVQKPKKQNTYQNPYMTEQEEIIAWNRWRSNLQNQIMRDSQIDYAPLGTLFTFTFVVDKFGNVSNINVQCSNSNYMDAVKNRVKPAIANLQRKPILKFPRGSQRTSTVVIGGFIIGTEERFSTPDQFSDYERITY